MIRLKLKEHIEFKAHRSGWGYCLNQLQPYYSDSGVLFDSFIEKTFSWDLKQFQKIDELSVPYIRPWVGVLHNPPDIPEWFDLYSAPQMVLEQKIFKESLKQCKCIVVLSDYLKNWLQNRINIPVVSAKHPTEIPRHKWSIRKFCAAKSKPIVQIGYWLRKFDSIAKLKTSNHYKKIWLTSNYDYSQWMLEVFNKLNPHFYEQRFMWSGVDIKEYISNEEYDELMTHSINLVNLYDSSANNAIIESIARNTPLLINKIKPVVEYLGEEYPLYFDDLNHASQLIKNHDKIIEAHLYLKSMDKHWLSGRFFANDLIEKVNDCF